MVEFFILMILGVRNWLVFVLIFLCFLLFLIMIFVILLCDIFMISGNFRFVSVIRILFFMLLLFKVFVIKWFCYKFLIVC